MSTEYSHSHTHNYHTLIVILPDVEEDLLSLDAAVVLSKSIRSVPYIETKSVATSSQCPLKVDSDFKSLPTKSLLTSSQQQLGRYPLHVSSNFKSVPT